MNKEESKWLEKQIEDMKIDSQYDAAYMLCGKEIADYMKNIGSYEMEIKPVKIKKGKMIF